jgi:hypothetical protein
VKSSAILTLALVSAVATAALADVPEPDAANADRVRQLLVEADALDRSATRLRGRQMLRRRAVDLERDPFAGIDGAKRNMALGPLRLAPDRLGPRMPGTSGPAPPPDAGLTAGATPTAAALLPMRTVLDTPSLAEGKRLEGAREPPADADALERAAADLRRQAQALQTQP